MAVLTALLLVSWLAPDLVPTRDTTPIDRLSWLTGCWSRVRPGGMTEEHWMAPRGGTMLGMSRTVAKGRIAEHEFIQIRVQDGRLVYIAQPSTQATTTFTAVSATDRDVVFENLAHDFPQRVIYRKGEGGATLQARIEGLRDGQLRGIDFPYVAVACGLRR